MHINSVVHNLHKSFFSKLLLTTPRILLWVVTFQFVHQIMLSKNLSDTLMELINIPYTHL